MDEKLTQELLNRYKELAFARRATLRAILKQATSAHRTPEERLNDIESLCEAAGISEWQERPTSG